ncbi:MAG TPA: RcnB family protein [Xanthomonadaceae bacterium]|jgi:Ni/Co efflux regulator RcnB|nr:RcnB family protein [Xanthomonadaceae bacterium]
MKQVLKLAPLMLALAAVAMPAAAKDKWRGHDKHDRYGYYDGRYDRRDDRDDDRRWDRDDRRAYYAGYRDGRRDDRRWDDRRWDDRDRRYHPVSGHWDNGRRGPPPWARGRDYRSYGYRQVYYVPVNDYGRYRLYRPDYGYRWVRDDRNNFLLVAATSGIISQILSPGY